MELACCPEEQTLIVWATERPLSARKWCLPQTPYIPPLISLQHRAARMNKRWAVPALLLILNGRHSCTLARGFTSAVLQTVPQLHSLTLMDLCHFTDIWVCHCVMYIQGLHIYLLLMYNKHHVPSWMISSRLNVFWVTAVIQCTAVNVWRMHVCLLHASQHGVSAHCLHDVKRAPPLARTVCPGYTEAVWKVLSSCATWVSLFTLTMH